MNNLKTLLLTSAAIIALTCFFIFAIGEKAPEMGAAHNADLERIMSELED